MKKILAIDDQSDNLITIKAVIRSYLPGYKVLTALSGTEGIKLAREEQPDTILLDIIMPGIDGFEVCQMLKADEQTSHIPVVMITAIKTDSESRIRGLENGADAFLSKPIDPPELISQIKVMLRIKESEDKLRNEKTNIEQTVESRTAELILTNNKFEKEITEHKKAKEALKESELKYRSLIECSSDAIFCVDDKGQYKFTNQLFARTFGKTPDYFIGKSFWDVYSKEQADLRYEATKRLFQTGESESLEVEVELPDKTLYFLATTNPVKDETGKVILNLTHATDITKLKQAEEVLKKTLVRDKALLDAIPDMMFVFDSKVTIVDFYANNRDGLFLQPENFLGKKVDEVLPGELALKTHDMIANALTTRQLGYLAYELEINGLLKQFESRYVSCGNDQVLSIVRDITDLKKTENELIKSKEKAEESDRLKSAFLANMSHEIRTPMNAIVGFAGMISDPDLTDEERKTFSGIIQSRSDDLMHIINDLLEISRIESGSATIIKQNVPLNAIIDEMEAEFLQRLKKTKKTNLTLSAEKDTSGKFMNLITDGYILKQIFSNLLENAIKYSESGAIRFGYHAPEKGAITCYVADEGIGISREDQLLIFEHFRQAETPDKHKYGGSGLGLAICKGSLDLLGGEIWVESEPGKGSTFYFTLPYDHQISLPDLNQVSNKNIPDNLITNGFYNWSGKKILLVEDEETNMQFLTTILKRTGAQLVCAYNGFDLRNHYDQIDNFNLVLLDIRLPDASGWDLAKEIKKMRPKLPVITQTAYAMSTDQLKSEEAGCDGYISKPINKDKLLKMLAEY
ncbi:MAG: response regulator, partial [Bacteroidota bacterium]